MYEESRVRTARGDVANHVGGACGVGRDGPLLGGAAAGGVADDGSALRWAAYPARTRYYDAVIL